LVCGAWRSRASSVSGVNLKLNRLGLERHEGRSGKNLMPAHRRRFRIEQALVGEVPMPSEADGDVSPMHREIMTELRAIRAQMGRPVNGAGTEPIGESVTRGVAEANALLETYRAQIEQCEKLKVELVIFID
jgi:chemotaxis protein CheZ